MSVAARAGATSARLVEVFSSFQGEGPLVGVPQVFVRFELCNLHCRYCDTPDSLRRQDEVEIRTTPCSEAIDERRPNPVSLEDLLAILDRIDPPEARHHSIVLTGGEPLLQHAFLACFLPAAQAHRPDRRFCLETDAVLFEPLSALIPYLDVIAADIKIPSATGQAARWADHRRFLELCHDRYVYAKLVVARETTEAEITEALSSALPDLAIPVVIQPVTAFGGVEPPSRNRLVGLVRAASRIARDVRCLPQVHHLLALP